MTTDSTDGLVFLPLGGAGEIGMNLYAYGVDGKWLIVDFGISFGDETTPGVDVLLPDPVFLAERKKDVVGIVITHGHEDHLGAVQYLWPRLECPVYATPFTAAYLRLKLAETSFRDKIKLIEMPLGGRRGIGPFDVELVSMTHSIPEPNALAIRTRHGMVVHSGDWKLDPDPLVGEATAIDRLRALGEEGVLALVGDSTNALEPGSAGSEAGVETGLTELFATLENRIAVTCFSTNVARLHAIARAAHANGRHCALVGRSLWRIHQAASATGYMDPPEPFLTDNDIGYIPRDRIVLCCTGSQGEPRAALSRIAVDDHPAVALERGDAVVYSAREIPGNEKAIGRVQNALIRRGIRVITASDAPVHVSGHPARDELATLYQWLRPRIAIPMHGETRHLEAHAALARSCQVAEAVVPHDGTMIRIAPGPAEIVDHVPTGRLGLDGTRVVRIDDGALRGRHRIINNGAVVVTAVLNNRGELTDDAQIALLGYEETDELIDLEDDLLDSVQAAIDGLRDGARHDDHAVTEAARGAVRRTIRRWNGKKPVTHIHVVRV